MVDDCAETSQKIISTDWSKLLVLIAEDEFLIKANLEEVVTEAGFEHMAVSNAGEAIRALEKDSARFCALITDVRMPGQTNGWDLARRARELRPLMPVIYMTGDSAKEWVAQGVPNSVLLQKPFVHARAPSFLLGLLGGAAPTAAVCLPSRPSPIQRSTHRRSQSIVGWPLDRSIVLLSLSPLPLLQAVAHCDPSLKAGGLPRRVFSTDKFIVFSRAGRLIPLGWPPHTNSLALLSLDC